MQNHKFLIIFFIFAFCFQTSKADIDRWLKWEIERNDLHFNRHIFKALPSESTLRNYQQNDIWEVEIPASEITILKSNPSPEIISFFTSTNKESQKLSTSSQLSTLIKNPSHITLNSTDKVKFFIHKRSISLFRDLIANNKMQLKSCIPTTSGRTVALDSFFIKLAVPDIINGIPRTVYPLQMERALAINAMLSEIPETEQKKHHFGFLKESMAIHSNSSLNPYGFIIREIPDNILNGTDTLAPLTSFYAKNKGKSLLDKAAELVNLTPEDFFAIQLLPSLLESFSYAASFGIILEAHQQNTLVELDQSGRFTGRIFYRDLDGARVDFSLREKIGLSINTLKTVSNPEWVFALSQIAELKSKNTIVQESLNKNLFYWTPLFETAFRSYMIGSSIELGLYSFGIESNLPFFENWSRSYLLNKGAQSTYSPMHCNSVLL